MYKITWLNNNQLKIEDEIKKPKKITGTRLGSILDVNTWNTPFKTFCEITKLYEEPFVDSIYTIAGKTIEHKQINYLKKAYFLTNVKSPIEVYGIDYFNKTRGDFFPNNKYFGGMWDALSYENDEPNMVIECKTTKRAEDWENDIPIYYSLQASLYAYLLGIDKVCVIVSFVDNDTYNKCEYILNNFNKEEIDNKISSKEIDNIITYKPSAKNTQVYTFNVSEKFPNFSELLNEAMAWWNNHIETGISPAYDEKKDKDYLYQIKANSYSHKDENYKELIDEIDELYQVIDDIEEKMKEKKDRLKVCVEKIKDYCKKTEEFKNTNSIIFPSNNYVFTLSKSSSTTIDKDLLKEDGLLDKYLKKEETLRFTKKRSNK